MAKLKLDVVSATGAVYSGDADMVVAPATEGEVAILPSHAALITTLSAGELRVRNGQEERLVAVSGGFLEVLANRVTVLADSAEDAAAIDIERAEAALKRAQESLAQQPKEQDLEQALAALSRAQVRIKLARRQRERGGQRPQTRG
jgi:F-type H+-transporting ATPase subunit epsilon